MFPTQQYDKLAAISFRLKTGDFRLITKYIPNPNAENGQQYDVQLDDLCKLCPNDHGHSIRLKIWPCLRCQIRKKQM